MKKLTLRIWILIFAWIIAIILIAPNFESGVLVKSVEKDSAAADSGLHAGEIIKQVNLQEIKNLEDYSRIISKINVSPVDFIIETDSGTFSYTSKTIDFDVDNITIVRVYGEANSSGLKENISLLKVNSEPVSNDFDFFTVKNKIEPKVSLNIITNKAAYTARVNAPLEITVGEVPRTNIKTGLDLQGGARALVKPERQLTPQELEDLLAVSRYRLNVYGVSDVNIRAANDLSGNTYMLVEVAGASPSELSELIAQQGKFEAKIGNETVFSGGSKDITSVCRNDAKCAGIQSCQQVSNGFLCRFGFTIYLSEEAARKHADITGKLGINATAQGNYLSKNLDLHLDDVLTDSLLISEDLKGQVTTQIQVQGSGAGATQQEAIADAGLSMQKLQTVLITGSLPFKLELQKVDSVSALLGKEFGRVVFLSAIVAFLSVTIVLFIRFRRIRIVSLVVLTMVSELVFVLAIAAFIKWNLDLASIAGIIASIGTGVDDQIVIIDESRLSKSYSMKQRIKRAFTIIFGSYSTVVASLIPLLWAGAGLLKGFAITTLLGITVGVLITRPAFADMISRSEN